MEPTLFDVGSIDLPPCDDCTKLKPDLCPACKQIVTDEMNHRAVEMLVVNR